MGTKLRVSGCSRISLQHVRVRVRVRVHVRVRVCMCVTPFRGAVRQKTHFLSLVEKDKKFDTERFRVEAYWWVFAKKRLSFFKIKTNFPKARGFQSKSNSRAGREFGFNPNLFQRTPRLRLTSVLESSLESNPKTINSRSLSARIVTHQSWPPTCAHRLGIPASIRQSSCVGVRLRRGRNQQSQPVVDGVSIRFEKWSFFRNLQSRDVYPANKNTSCQERTMRAMHPSSINETTIHGYPARMSVWPPARVCLSVGLSRKALLFVFCVHVWRSLTIRLFLLWVDHMHHIPKALQRVYPCAAFEKYMGLFFYTNQLFIETCWPILTYVNLLHNLTSPNLT